MSLDEAEVTFTRRVPAELSTPETLQLYAGTYLTPTGAQFQVAIQETARWGSCSPASRSSALLPWKPRTFRVKEFSDVTIEFEVGPDGTVTAMKQTTPSGVTVLQRVK